MLHKSWISDIEIYSEQWHQMRLGKATSSKMFTQTTDKPLTDGAWTYIYQKVGEELTGHTTAEDEQIEDENTIWGLTNEPIALQRFQEKMKVDFLATQKLIYHPDSRFSSTPDAIWIHGLALNGEEYNVSTNETKCPRKYHKFIPLYLCTTPAQLKAFNRNYYWQVLDQMDNCDSAIGYFCAFHPLFPEGSNLRIIEFKKIELWDDFKLLKQRKKLFVEKFEETRASFIFAA
jgi:hypothetical protein